MPKYSRAEFPVNSIVYEKVCPYCNQDFWANKPRAIYCSDKCRVYTNKAKREADMPKALAGTSLDVEGRKGMEPMLIGAGRDLRLVYYNPYREKRKQLDPGDTFGKKHLSGEHPRTLEEVLDFHTLRMQEYECYYKSLKDLYLADFNADKTKLTDRERCFLQDEKTKVDINIVGIRKRLQHIREKSQDPDYIPW